MREGNDTGEVMKTIAWQVVLLTVLVLGLVSSPAGVATPAQTEEKILVSIANSDSDHTLYTLNPDGSGKTRLFDFHSSPKFTTGEIYGPRISADGKHVYFHSEHAYIYTPARRNVFRITSFGSGLDQITPGPESGIWGESGNSTVSGSVQHGDGSAWGNCPVYLEGMDMVYSAVDGSFAFHNVPPGARWLMAYRPTLDAWDSTTVNVVSGVDNTGLTLTPDSTARMNFEHPVAYGDRIYYRFTNTKIQWTDLNFSAQHDIYTSQADLCTGVPSVDAFDVGSLSGKIAIYDYQEGCGVGNNNHNGIYVTDEDGNNKQLLVDLLNSTGWSGSLVAEVFWSPDESYLAFDAYYNGNPVIAVVDAGGTYLGGVTYPATSDETYGLDLYGWSPDGKWLLYVLHTYRTAEPEQRALLKIAVNESGAPDTNNIVPLLNDPAIAGATWGQLAEANRIYVPLVVRNH